MYIGKKRKRTTMPTIRHSHTDRERSADGWSVRQQIADILAEHWWDQEIYSCVCGSQKRPEWTYHVADLILDIPRINTEPQ
jgi:hypothetical protein